jgi:hypothetical protein
MTQGLSSQGLLILIVPPNLEEMLVDFLLQQTTVSGFTSSKVNGHGAVNALANGGASAELSMVEQVTGRQQRVQFMLHATIIDLQQLVITLKTRFKSSDVHCLLLPMVDIPAA